MEEEFKTYKLNYIVFGGNRLIRAPLLGECKHPRREAQKISQSVLNLRYEDSEAFPHSLRKITSSLAFTF